MAEMLLLALLACGPDSEDTGPVQDTDSEPDTDTAPPDDADSDGSPAGEDCDDADPSVFPGAPEVCDGADNDCDRLVDDDDTVSDAPTWYLDEDDDGYGTDTTLVSCLAPDGHVSRGGDCDDAVYARNPGAAEVCGDGIDNNCDDTANGCTLLGEVDLHAHPAGNVILDDGGEGGFTVLRSVGDVDGDDAPDILVSSNVDDEVWIFRGAVTGVNRLGDAWAHITGGRNDNNFATNARGYFDWDLDGRGDLALPATQYARDDIGYVRIFTNLAAGETDGATSAAQLEYTNGAYVGAYALVTGDLDGDGDANDILGRTASTDGPGVSWLAGWGRGSDDLIVNLPVDTDAYNVGGVALADTNGDGLDDLVFAAPNVDPNAHVPNAGRIYVAYGPVTGIAFLEDTYDVLLTGGRSDDYAGNSLDFAGDGDGDGHLDLLVGASGNSSGADAAAYLVRGPLASGTLMDAAASFSVSNGGEGSTWIGDVDGDGRDELAITDADQWAVYLYRGSVSGTQQISTGTTPFSGTNARGSNVAAAGDLDLDGHAEILLGGLYQVWGTANYEAAVVIDGSGL